MNRELVENATHPDALEAIAEELGNDWKKHGIEIEGKAIAEVQGADSNVIRRDKSFFTDNRDVLFPSNAEERIRTRLGDEGTEVEFDPPPASPFDALLRIDSMTIANHMLRGEAPGGPVTPTEAEGGFTFAIGEQRFRYDRHGLRRAG
jgi:CRISPR-associated endonuclease/helicase Cas3